MLHSLAELTQTTFIRLQENTCETTGLLCLNFRIGPTVSEMPLGWQQRWMCVVYLDQLLQNFKDGTATNILNLNMLMCASPRAL